VFWLEQFDSELGEGFVERFLQIERVLKRQ